MNKNKFILSTINNNISPFAQLLLLFKYSTSIKGIICLIIIIPKYLPILIITTNFCINNSDDFKYNYALSSYLRKFTLFNYFKNISLFQYIILSIIIFFFQIIFIFYIIYYFYLLKKRNNKKIKLSKISIFIYYINAFFSQYFIEFYSFIFVIIFRKNFILHQEGIFKNYNQIKLIKEESNNELSKIIILSVLNIIQIIYMNLFLYYNLVIINVVYKTRKILLNFKHLKLIYIFIFYSNFFGLQYYEMIVTEKQKNILKIIYFSILFTIFLYEIYYNIIFYEDLNYIYLLIRILNTFCFISLIFELYIGIFKIELKIIEIISYLLLKLIITGFILNFLLYLRRRKMLSISGNFLFENIESKNLYLLVESYNFLLDKLLDINQNIDSCNDIVNLLLCHKKKCSEKNCKCKFIQPLPSWNIQDNTKFKLDLTKNFGFFLETTFINLKKNDNIFFLFFIVDYFYLLKCNLLFSFSILKNYISKKFKRLSIIESFEIYCFYFHFSKIFNNKFEIHQSYNKFANIFNQITFKIKLNKKIENYCLCFENIINEKIKFENSLKFSTDKKTNEILEINSLFLTKKNFLKIIKEIEYLSNNSNKLKKNIIHYAKERNTLDFYYITYLFFTFFEKHIPYILLKYYKNINEKFSSENLNEQFEEVLSKFFQNNVIKNRIILKFEENIKIKYISNYLCTKLSYEHSKMINENFNILFPNNIQEIHTKNILSKIFVFKNLFFIRKTYIFDKNNFIYPCELKVCTLPNLNKDINIIIEISLNDNDLTENVFYFLTDQNFNTLGISKNFEYIYKINLNYLNKIDFELLNIFEINQKFIQKKFKKSLDVIKSFKKELYYNDLEFYVKKLFGIDLNKNSKFICNEYSLESSNFQNIKTDLSIFLNKKKKEKFTYIINKKNFIKNLIKCLQRIIDSKLSEEEYKTINKSILILNKLLNSNNLDISSISIMEDNLKVDNRSFISYKPINKLNVICKIKKLYDSPIYFFKFIEQNYKAYLDKKNFSNLSLISLNKAHSIDINHTLISHQKNENILNIIGKNNNKYNLNYINKISHFNNDYSNKQSLYSQLKQLIDNNSKNKLKKNSGNNINFLTNNKMIFLFIFISICCILISLINIIFKNYRIKKIDLLTKNLTFSCLLNDKFTYFYSSLLTEGFEYSNYTSISLEQEKFKDYLNYTKNQFNKAIFDFLYSLNNLTNYEQLNSINYLFNFFLKNKISWETYKKPSSIPQEFFYLIFLIDYSIKYDKKENIIEDLNYLFFNNYLNNQTIEIKTKYMQTLFFLHLNFESIIFSFFDIIQFEINEVLNNYLKKSNRLLIICIIFWFFINILFFIICFVHIVKLNNFLYKEIILMLIGINDKFNKNSFKYNPKNFYMKNKIKKFLILLFNFSKENKENFFKIEENNILNNKNNLEDDEEKNNKISHIKSKQKKEIRRSKKSFQNLNINLNNSSYLNINQSYSNPQHLIKNKNMKSPRKQILQNLNEKNEYKKSSKNLDYSSINNINNSIESLKVNTHEEKLEEFNSIKFLELLRVKSIQIIFFIYFILAFFLIVCFILFCKQIYDLNIFNSCIFYILKLFNSFRDIITPVSALIIILREILMVQIEFPNLYYTFKSNYYNYLSNIVEVVSEKKFSSFNNLQILYEQMNLEINDPKFDINIICNDNDLCIKYLYKNNSICSQGIYLGYEVLCQKILTIFNDYANFNKSENISKETIKNFIVKENFDEIEINTEFVFSIFQNNYYKYFIQDYNEILKNFKSQTYIIDIIFLLFEFVSVLIILFIIAIIISKKKNKIKKGINSFYNAFYI